MLEFVEKLLDSKDNIIDQLILLKQHKNHKEVKRYMKSLLSCYNSPYFNYCIDTYYLEKQVEPVEPKVGSLPNRFCNKEIEALIGSVDDLIEELTILRKNKRKKVVKEYMDQIKNHFYAEIPYYQYCIAKYYDELDVEEVPKTAKTLGITLYKIYYRNLELKQEKAKRRNFKKLNIKEGDEIKLLSGPFQSMVGTVKSVNKRNAEIVIIVNLFGQDTELLCTAEDKIMKLERKKRNERKN